MDQSISSQTQAGTIVPVKARYVLYSRKSSDDSSEKQALSIESQVKEMLRIAERDGLEIIDIRRESHSAKDSGQRPVFNELLRDIRSGRFNAILVWHPDRLSRNAGDLGSLVDLMDQKLLVEIKTYGQQFRNSPNEKFLLMILCSQAKLENDNKSVNVKRGLRTRVEMGLWPSVAPTGYFNEKRIDKKCQVLVDPERAPIIKQMFEKVAYEKWSGRKLYHWLRFDLNFRTKSNHHLSLANIFMILHNLFYYGAFEYPKKSGNFYTGKHEPLITRELFEKVQEQLKRSDIIHPNKEFAFTKLMECGFCESGITANERIKKQQNGNVHRYVYYGCTKSKDRECKSGYIKEEELIKQLIELIGAMDINEIDIQNRFNEERKRILKFQKEFLGLDDSSAIQGKFNARNYAGYVLNEGTTMEKRELLGALKSRIIFKDKTIIISNR